jgi:protein gp37/ParB-like chromosome segregation protein Spo0J
MQKIPLSVLHAHPQNPRLVPREDVIEQIAAHIIGSGSFDEAHALIVRPIDSGFQIISGHNRKLAAERAGLGEVPCWVREMDDATAYMELVRANAQGELSALERGIHALNSDKSVRAYAEEVGRKVGSIQDEREAAKVFQHCRHMPTESSNRFRQLVEIHAAPSWLWPSLVHRMTQDGMTVDATRKMIAGVKDAPNPPLWADASSIAYAVVWGEMRLSEIGKLSEAAERAEAAITRAELKAEQYITRLNEALGDKKPSRLSEVLAICNQLIEEQENEIAEARRDEIAQQQEQQDREARMAAFKSNISLETWKSLDQADRNILISEGHIGSPSSFNKQENEAIEWAQWSWNPVTGCEHDCPYCYARDIATSARTAKAFPNGFDPTFRPAALAAPKNTKVPKDADTDTRFKNVFTCSMADLFGRWVPSEWIEAVFSTVRENPQWNFLFLTKFPQRLSEFDVPENAWIGTTVDLQARVKNAEKAFEKIKTGVRWLSVEPMLEPLKFDRLDLFQWIVIGGASRSSETPEFKPPFEWVADLVRQARAANVKVYFKTNLLGSRILELPFDAPIVSTNQNAAPDVFHYLGKKREILKAAE